MESFKIKPNNYAELVAISAMIDLLPERQDKQPSLKYYKPIMKVGGNSTGYGWTMAVVTSHGELNAATEKHQSTEISLTELAQLVEKSMNTLRVEEYEVEFRAGGVQVGCTFVPTETVDRIHAKLHNSK